MGPRLFSRGNELPPDRLEHQFASLQWGRDSSVAEMRNSKPLLPSSASLQWGRDSSVAEMRVLELIGLARQTFNGAATLQSRKSYNINYEGRTKDPSMGPRLFSRGNGVCWRQS